MRFKSRVAVMAIIIKDNKILLQKRKNTEFMNNQWDFAATGHVEENEKLTSAIIREAKEEIGICITKLDFVHIEYLRISDEITYTNVYFNVIEFTGMPKICEDNKISRLEWFDLDGLPVDIVQNRRRILENIKNKQLISEVGFKDNK